MTVNKLARPSKDNAVQEKINEIIDDYVDLSSNQNITGVKTFVGQKRIGFKQSGSSDKLGFTLYNNSGTEKGYLEYNPSNTVDSVPLMTLGNYASVAASLTHVGFRKYSSVSGASGAYNLLAPLISDAKTPFNLTTTYTNFYLPLGFSNGTTTVTTAKTGVVDLSSLGYALSSNLATVATSGSYSDLIDKPTIPTVNNATLTITQGGVSKGTFTANASSDVTIELDAGGGGGTATDVQINGTSITSSNVANIITNSAYNSSSNKIATMSDLPTVNNNTITIQQGGTTVDSFTLNQSSNKTINIPKDIFIAEYDSTTFSDIVTAIDAGKMIFCFEATNSIVSSMTYVDKNNEIVFSGSFIDGLGEGTLFTYIVDSSNSWSTSQQVVVPTTTSSVTSASTAALTSGGAYTNLITSVAAHSTDANKINVTKAGSTATITINDVAHATSADSATSATSATTATTASKLGSSTVGGTTTPIYLSSGTPTALSYTIAKSVPADAVFTDTTYSTFTGATSIAGGTSGLVPAPSSGDNDKILTGNSSWSSLKTINSTSLLGSGNIDTSEIFVATYGTTTRAELDTAITANKAIVCVYNDNIFVYGTKMTVGNEFEYSFSRSNGDSGLSFLHLSGLGSGDGTWSTSNIALAKTDLSNLSSTGEAHFQAPLVSGINIKTVNSTSLLGSGNIDVQPTLVSGTNIKTINNNSILGSGDITVTPTVTYDQTTQTLTIS